MFLRNDHVYSYLFLKRSVFLTKQMFTLNCLSCLFKDHVRRQLKSIMHQLVSISFFLNCLSCLL